MHSGEWIRNRSLDAILLCYGDSTVRLQEGNLFLCCLVTFPVVWHCTHKELDDFWFLTGHLFRIAFIPVALWGLCTLA